MRRYTFGTTTTFVAGPTGTSFPAGSCRRIEFYANNIGSAGSMTANWQDQGGALHLIRTVAVGAGQAGVMCFGDGTDWPIPDTLDLELAGAGSFWYYQISLIGD